MKTTLKSLLVTVVVSLTLLAALALADWTTNTTPFGTTVSNGDITFKAPDKEAGENMAKILNKADKASKKADKGDDDGDDSSKG
jgi:hypothetical protein